MVRVQLVTDLIHNRLRATGVPHTVADWARTMPRQKSTDKTPYPVFPGRHKHERCVVAEFGNATLLHAGRSSRRGG